MRIMLFCFLWIFVRCLHGQDYEFLTLKKEAYSVKGFSPKGWLVSDSVQGDLDKDGLLDQVFILKKQDSVAVADINGDKYLIQPRIIAVGIKQNDKYLLKEINQTLLNIYNSPKTYDDPFDLIHIDNGVLIIQFSFDYIYGNLNFYTYKFQLQENQFLLIEAEVMYVNRKTMNFDKSNYHFLEKKWSLTSGVYASEDKVKPIEKMEWFDLKIDKLKSLRAINQPGSWEIQKNRWL